MGNPARQDDAEVGSGTFATPPRRSRGRLQLDFPGKVDEAILPTSSDPTGHPVELDS